MRQGIRLLIFTLTMLVLFASIGCSGGSDTLTGPGGISDNGSVLKNGSDNDASGHVPLMSGKFIFNLATGTVDIVPERGVDVHADVTLYVVPPQCWDCVKPVGLTIQPTPGDPTKNDWNVRVRLKNPTPLEAYNVRAIFFPENSGPTPPSWATFVTIEDYNGLTKVFGGGEYHRFVNWFVGDSTSRDKFYGNGWTWDKWMKFRIPVSFTAYEVMQISYKIDACWPGPVKESPDIFHDFVYQTGGWFASTINGKLYIPVWDWQGDISSVQVDLTPVSEGIGTVMCTYDHSEIQPADWPNATLHYYTANVNYIPIPGKPIFDGTKQVYVTVVDSVSPWHLVDLVPITVTFDTTPPVSVSDGGEFKGLVDLMNSKGKIRFYYDRATDPSGVIYVFYNNFVQHAWDSGSYATSFECNEIDMNWPPAYPGCYQELDWALSSGGRWWSVDAWDGPNNKAHTTVEKWGKPVQPVQRWLKLVGDIGNQNTNWGSSVMVDMDDDGDDDVVIANRMASVFCFDGMGGGSPQGLKWTFDTNQSAIYSSPAAADVTGDGVPEVFISTNGVEEGGVFAINGATGFELWHFVTADIVDATVCITDLNGGGVDVVVGDNTGHLYALDGLTGNEIWTTPFIAGGGIGSSAAAGDVNSDSVPDLSFGAYDGHVYMVDGSDGSLIWKFNCGTGLFSVESSPAMFDASGDGVPDVVVGADDTVWCFNGPGSGGQQTSPLWSVQLNANFRNSPSIGDCNLDGIPDVVITGRQGAPWDLYIINGGNGDGIWSVDVPGGGNIFTPVILADVTGDGHMNAIFGANDPFMPNTEFYYVYNVDRLDYGVLLFQEPSTSVPNQALGMPNCPTLGDVNNDGKWDMSYGSVQGRVFVHNFDTEIPSSPEMRPWTSFRGNNRRDGRPFMDY